MNSIAEWVLTTKGRQDNAERDG